MIGHTNISTENTTITNRSINRRRKDDFETRVMILNIFHEHQLCSIHRPITFTLNKKQYKIRNYRLLLCRLYLLKLYESTLTVCTFFIHFSLIIQFLIAYSRTYKIVVKKTIVRLKLRF